MTNSKTTRKALLSSALALLMCVAMLIATTFAWFTDTASTSVNKIQAGTLKVGLEMASGTNEDGSINWVDAEGETLSFKKAADGEKQEVLWEPGCTYELPALRVVNEGNLAFKYKVVISGIDGDAELLKAIDFTVKFGNEEVDLDDWEGKLLPKGKTAASTGEEIENSSSLVISGHMKETAGNDYQGLSVDGIGVTVYATQYTYEYDSYNNTYDLNGMYVFDDYVNVTKTVETDKNTVIKDKEGNPTITATIPQGSLSTDTKELALIKKPTENPSSVKVETGQSALTTDVKIIDTTTKEVISAQGDKYFTIDIQLGQVDLQKFYHKGKALDLVSDSSTAFTRAGQYKYNFNTGVVTFTTDSFSTFTAVFKFAGGDGSADHPYLIATKEHFQAINKEYTANKFAYYKIVDGVDTLDLNDAGRVYLRGVFDGNNKTVKVNNSLFSVTYSTSADSVQTTIKNMNVVENQSAGALVGTACSDVINFENVKISGVIERNWHGAAFVGYGPNNMGNDYAKGYTLNFTNCSCDATIVTRGEGGVAILVGHAYQGGENTLTINMDSATDTGIESAKLYGANEARGYKYYIMGNGSGVIVNVDGNQVADAHTTFAATSLGATVPVKADDKYTVTADTNAAYIKVQVLSQLTAYDNDGGKIASLSGITSTHGTCYSESVTGGNTVEVFGKVTSVVLVNALTESGYPEYTLADDGILTITTNTTDNYLTGTVRLGAYQYDVNGALISSGVLDIAETTDTPAGSNVKWTIK